MYKLVGFTSVLEVAFSMSFILVLLEIGPWMKTRTLEIRNEFRKFQEDERIPRIAEADLKSLFTLRYLVYLLIQYWVFAGRIIEKGLLILTLLGAITCVGFLIRVGFDQDFCLDAFQLALLLLFLLAPVPLYTLEYIILCAQARLGMKILRSMLDAQS
jgi:hypothetical protein